MSLYHPLWYPPAPGDLWKGIAAIEKARSIGAKTQRERDYIGAIAVFYKDADKVPHRQRALAWRDAMQRLSARYPEDPEAAIFYALALIATAPPTDKTYLSERQAAKILNRILAEQPNHPGVAHYLIHSYDSPQLASLALPAARTYAKIAPVSPHALHMPSHIFTRLGLWQDSIESNLASAAAAKAYMARAQPGVTSQDQLHAMDYLAYAYLQTCQDDEAKRIVEAAASTSRVDLEVLPAAYALAAIPARYALERKRWSAAAALQLEPAWFPWIQFRQAEAITHFARALGSAKAAEANDVLTKALTANPKSAVLETALGFVQLRAGTPWLAAESARRAAKLDPCNARSRLLNVKILRLNSLYRSAAADLKTAHLLDPYDPDIRLAWLQTLPIQERIKAAEDFLNSANGEDADEQKQLRFYLDDLKKVASQPRKSCQLTSKEQTTELPFARIMRDGTHVRAYGLDVKLNNHSARPQIDTGAGGLLISRSLAKKPG